MDYEYNITKVLSKVKEFYESFKGGIKIILNSAKKSKITFFIQTINALLSYYLILYLVPSSINLVLAKMDILPLSLPYILMIGLLLLFTFNILILITIKNITNLSSFYKTDLPVSLGLMLFLMLALCFCNFSGNKIKNHGQ